MATVYGDIFKRFLSKIDDDLYNILTPEQSEEDLTDIMKSSFLMIKYPRADLSDRDDIGYTFNFDLEERLQELISVAMKYEWSGRQIYKIENTRHKFTEGDFKLTSQASHLEKLILMQRQSYDELDKKTKNKSYTTTKGSSNWSSLSGGAR